MQVNALPARAHPALGLVDLAALALWAGAFGLEVTADRQKSAWRAEKDAGEHDEKFVNRGVWASVCQHPNYLGEVHLWVGQFLLSFTALNSAAGRAYFGPYALPLAAASPLLEFGLIRYISGVPLLQKSMNEKLGDDPEYKKYKATTPRFWPIFGGKY